MKIKEPKTRREKFLEKKADEPWQKAELHLHTSEDKKDGYFIKYSLIDFLRLAKKKKYKIFAVTNHESVPEKNVLARAKMYADKVGMVLIPGVEANINGSHILLYFDFDVDHNRIISEIRSFDDISIFYKNGIIKMIGAPHPFYHHSSLGNKIYRHYSLFDFVEYSWFYTNPPSWFPFKSQFFNMNIKAVEFARKEKIPLMAGGDLHNLDFFSKDFTMIRCKKDIGSFFETVKEAKKLKLESSEISKVINIRSSPLSLPRFSFISLKLIVSIVRYYSKEFFNKLNFF